MKKKISLLIIALLITVATSAQTYFYTFTGNANDAIENYVRTSTYPTVITVLSETININDCSGNYTFPILYKVYTQAYTDYIINIEGITSVLRVCRTISILVIGQKVNIYTN